jgi:hypothetical protein
MYAGIGLIQRGKLAVSLIAFGRMHACVHFARSKLLTWWDVAAHYSQNKRLHEHRLQCSGDPSSARITDRSYSVV